MTALWVIVLCGALSIVYAAWATSSVLKSDAGNPRMQEIAAAVAEGAQAYLKRQYMTIAMVGVVIFALLAYFLGMLVAIGFLIGAVLSGAAGFIGMNVSVRANVRTAQAATTSLAGGLELAAAGEHDDPAARYRRHLHRHLDHRHLLRQTRRQPVDHGRAVQGPDRDRRAVARGCCRRDQLADRLRSAGGREIYRHGAVRM